MFRFLTVSPVLLLFYVALIPPVHAQTNVLFVVDASGSMKKMIDGETRMSVAKDVLRSTLNKMPEEVQIGLLAYGHRKAKDCSDIELVAPLGSEDAKGLGEMIDKLDAKGETPIAESLRKAAKSFKAFKGQDNSIILVTDGLEECKGDPCAAAKELKDAGLDVAVNIIGFTLGEADAKKLQCVTETTGGKYYSAANTDDLTKALQDVQEAVQETAIVQEAKAPTFDGDVLSKKNGGKLVYAPSNAWQAINSDYDGSLDAATYRGEAVWSFKDNKTATFSQIEVLVTEASAYNLKDFEVLVSDELTGSYRSVGEFTVQNVKMMPEGWQGFKFPETTARFVKVAFKTSQKKGEYVRGNALRLIGSIDENSESTKETTDVEGINVLTGKNGGKLVQAPNDAWQLVNSDYDEALDQATYAGEAIWSFKDGKLATFSQVDVLLVEESEYNIKDFEILVSDELTGLYRSVGEFTVKNVKVMPEGWQRFKFPEATARFVKVVFKAPQKKGEYVRGNALRLIGGVDEGSDAVEEAAKVEGKNLLLQKNGGTLLVSPNDKWGELNDGSESWVATYTGEAVWAFKDEKAATIRAVKVLLPKSEQYNLKDFEVLVSSDGPTGDFRSVGEFTTQNLKVMPDGYQQFTFPEVEAKYIKFKLISDHGGGYVAAYELSVIGNLIE